MSDEQILILSMTEQNPPALLPPKRVCLLSICLCSRSRRQPLSDVSRKQRYNTLDFPGENRVPTGMLLAPIGNPEPGNSISLDTPPGRARAIVRCPHAGCCSAQTGKTGVEDGPCTGLALAPVFLAAARTSSCSICCIFCQNVRYFLVFYYRFCYNLIRNNCLGVSQDGYFHNRL